ncbi:MAG: sodium:solute symporter, partial [Gammaproteobacteria bacterium]|nr:sodium:solute symporter [Gammaproteobacteria bacterium]
GIWIIQTLPAVLLGTYTRWFDPWALLLGWAAGTLTGTWMALHVGLKPTFPLELAGYTFPGYTAFYTLILNLALAAVLTPVFARRGAALPAADETVPADYYA